MGRREKLVIVLGLTLTTCGCNRDADRLARICHKTTAKFDGVTENMRGKVQSGFGAMRGSLSESSLDSRVALRLRWDKDMAGAEVRVRTTGPGAVELQGVVADLSQRTRAVGLAHTTIGVEKVLDALTIEGDAGEAPEPRP
jgi:osmotically-inducible protein OsmY